MLTCYKCCSLLYDFWPNWNHFGTFLVIIIRPVIIFQYHLFDFHTIFDLLSRFLGWLQTPNSYSFLLSSSASVLWSNWVLRCLIALMLIRNNNAIRLHLSNDYETIDRLTLTASEWAISWFTAVLSIQILHTRIFVMNSLHSYGQRARVIGWFSIDNIRNIRKLHEYFICCKSTPQNSSYPSIVCFSAIC